jgi:hypothetical protein
MALDEQDVFCYLVYEKRIEDGGSKKCWVHLFLTEVVNAAVLL